MEVELDAARNLSAAAALRQWGTPEDGAFFASTLRQASDRHRRLLSKERGAAKAALQVGPARYCHFIQRVSDPGRTSRASAGEVEFILTTPHIPRATDGEERLMTCRAISARPWLRSCRAHAAAAQQRAFAAARAADDAEHAAAQMKRFALADNSGANRTAAIQRPLLALVGSNASSSPADTGDAARVSQLEAGAYTRSGYSST